MAIQWFPGHMHLTRKAIAERMENTDVVVEVLDARLPGSSANPLLATLTAGRPKLKILNKEDLADAGRTALWLAYFNAQADTRALALEAARAPAAQIVQACQALAPQRGGLVRPMRVLVCGIPNVGKSTLINRLVGRRQAKTGDEAGVTRQEQRLLLADDFYLYDTPGVLWPRIIVAQSGFNLAASGAVGRNAFDDEEVALELLAYLRGPYAPLLAARYAIDAPLLEEMPEHELLEAIGRRRGALQGGGRVNLQKTAEIVLHDFRSAALGRITLETPQEFARWLAEGKKIDAERQAARLAAREESAARKPGRRAPSAPRRVR
ncbi:ribosome biogenesis GTPase YlqF [Ramlibacter sp. H39-3-26]|uniref:ribosome biogenesis GTPase YlqF n=1 Tax=Curvibacter soli TaxID=3031331 RepID=UPI0023D99353|nr:ribosome biogenesis GTPase YlqF [Ramlibacter sp. H39-3-26]MDF1485297.1 ribosome biogenesis GTPase YlqF [Ramlibacter sp. H39-3-26]